MAGLGWLGDERAIPILLEWTAYGRTTPARRAAVQALARVGERRNNVIDALVGLLNDPLLRVRVAAVDALGKMNAIDALPELDRLANLDVEGRLRVMAMEAAQKIRAGKEPADELRRLRDDVDQLRAANAKLESKLAEFEALPVRSNGARSKVRR